MNLCYEHGHSILRDGFAEIDIGRERRMYRRKRRKRMERIQNKKYRETEKG